MSETFQAVYSPQGTTTESRTDALVAHIVRQASADQAKISNGYFEKGLLARLFSPLAGRPDQNTHLLYDSWLTFGHVNDPAACTDMIEDAKGLIQTKLAAQGVAAQLELSPATFTEKSLGSDSGALPGEEYFRLTATVAVPQPGLKHPRSLF